MYSLSYVSPTSSHKKYLHLHLEVKLQYGQCIDNTFPDEFHRFHFMKAILDTQKPLVLKTTLVKTQYLGLEAAKPVSFSILTKLSETIH